MMLCRPALLRFRSHEFILAASGAMIQIIDFHTHQQIDSLEDQTQNVVAMDASQVGGIIVVVAADHQVFFYLPVSQARLKWQLAFKSKISDNLPISTIKMSPLGDMCVMAGDRYVSVWTQDSSMDSFTQQIFYTSDETLHSNQMGQVVELLDSLKGQIKQCEILGDGRLFFTLEAGAKHVKVWYQDHLLPQPDSSVKYRRNYYLDLRIYETPESRREIEQFRLKQRSPTAYDVQPCLMMVQTSTSVEILMESMVETAMCFVRVHSVKLQVGQSPVECFFLPTHAFVSPDHCANKVQPHHTSKIFDTFRDDELKYKLAHTQSNGVIQSLPQYADSRTGLQQGYPPTHVSQFVVIEACKTVSVYRMQGLSNVPTRNCPQAISLVTQVCLSIEAGLQFASVSDCVLLQQQQSFSDVVYLLAQNEHGRVVCVDFELRKFGMQITRCFGLSSNQAPIQTLQHSGNMLALVLDKEIALYRGSQLCSVLPGQTFDFQWVRGQNMLLVMRPDRSIQLLRSDTGEKKDLNSYLTMEPYVCELTVVPNENTIGFQVIKCDTDASSNVTSLQIASLTGEGLVTHINIDMSSGRAHSSATEQRQSVFARALDLVEILCSVEHDGAAYFCLQTSYNIATGRTTKTLQQIQLLRVTPHSQTILFSRDISVQHKVQAKFQDGTLVTCLVEGDYDNFRYVMYFFSIDDNKYEGFVRLSELIALPCLRKNDILPMDFHLLDDMLTVVASDKCYTLRKKHGHWHLEQTETFLPYQPQSISIRNDLVILDQKFIRALPIQKRIPTASLPLYHPDQLKDLLLQGYARQVAQVLVELHDFLNDPDVKPIPDLARVNFQTEVKKQTLSMLDDPEEAEEADDFSKALMQKSDDLINLIAKEESLMLTKLTPQEHVSLAEFTLKFLAIHATDFYADKIASHLLTHLYYETEEISQEEVNHVRRQLGLLHDNKERKKEKVKFDLEQFIQQRMALNASRSVADAQKFSAFTSEQICMALYSENNDVVLDFIDKRLDISENLTWDMAKRLGLPIWVKSNTQLLALVEKMAKIEYKTFKGNEVENKAEHVAVWYVIMNKIEVLKLLFNVEVDGQKYVSFLGSDFSDPKIKRKAKANAMALISKKKPLLACAFELLAGGVQGAVQVATERMQDPMLAILFCRLLDPQNEEKQINAIVERHFLQRGSQFNDPYLKSLGRWLCGEYVKAVNELNPVFVSHIDQLFKTVDEFDLAFSEKVKKKDPSTLYPTLCQTSQVSLALLSRLQKAPEVKRLLNKNWQLDKPPAKGGGMFDDLLDYDSEEEEEKEPEPDQSESIQVKELDLMTDIIKALLRNGHTALAIIVMRENSNIFQQVAEEVKRLVARTQVSDVMHQKTLNAEMLLMTRTQLREQLSIFVDNNFIKVFLSRKGDQLPVLIDYMIKSGLPTSQIQSEIEAESAPLIDFVKKSSLYCGSLLHSDSLSVDQTNSLLALTHLGSQILACLNMAHSLIFQLRVNPDNVVSTKAEAKPIIKKTSHDGWFDEESSDEAAQPEIVAEQQPSPTQEVVPTMAELIDELNFKCRIGLLLSTTLYQMALIMDKFSMLCDAAFALIFYLSVQNKSAEPTTQDQLTYQVRTLNFDRIDIILQKATKSLQKNLEHARKCESDQQRKLCKIKEVKSIAAYQFLNHWFKFNSTISLFDMVFQNGIRVVGGGKKASKTNSFQPSDLVTILDEQFKQYEQSATEKLRFGLSPQQRQMLLSDLKSYLHQYRVSSQTQLIDWRYFASSEMKLQQFCETFSVKKYFASIKDLLLSHLDTLNEFEIDSQAFGDGVELFRQKGEPVSDFCVKGDYIGLSLQSLGTREISISTSLLFRKRTNQHELTDEELLSWNDCLHRFDQYVVLPVEPPSNETVMSALLTHQMKTSFSKIMLQKSIIQSRGNDWDGKPAEHYLQQVSRLEITHEDFAYAICAHPHLPIYLTGNARGIVCMWQVSGQTERSLKQWLVEPEVQPKDANSKKATIRKIEFTPYGDKFLSLNAEGSLFMHEFDMSFDSGALWNCKGQQITDFGLVDTDGTVVAMLSKGTKSLQVYDVLLDERIASAKCQGNLLAVDQERRQIFVFNAAKQGQMQIFNRDLVPGLAVQLSKEEITAYTWCGHRQQCLALGFSDGRVRFYDCSVKEVSSEARFWEEPKLCVNAFCSVGGKKGTVTALKVHSETGAVFGASSQGNVKLLRVQL